MLKLDGLVDVLTSYLESRFELAKLELRTEVTKLAAKAAFYVAGALLALFALLFLSITLAVALNLLTNSAWLGWLIVSLVYAIPAGYLWSQLTNKERMQKLVEAMEQRMTA